jgi:PIN domain nuclease of toxin-antitoxin system
VQLLLDTHIVLWWLMDSRRLPRRWRDGIADASTRVCVSAASIWEIAVKSGIGKLQLDLPRNFTLTKLASACGFEDLPIDARHAAEVASLPRYHSDPFDRLLIAQSIVENLTLVSTDRAVRQYGIAVLEE